MQFTRLRLTSKYVKITSEEDIKEWAKTSEDTVCSICGKKLTYRYSVEMETEFRSKFFCENHSKKQHFSFRHPKTKAEYDKIKPEDKPSTVIEKIPRKESKRETEKKKTTNSKKTTKHQTVRRKPLPKRKLQRQINSANFLSWTIS